MKLLSEGILVHSWYGDEDLPKISEAKEQTSRLMVAGRAMPQAEVQRRSKGWKVHRLETPRWKIMETPNSVVRGDIEPEGLRSVGVYAEEMNVMLRAAIGGGDSAPFRFRLFKESKDFRMYAARAGASNAESFYAPANMESSFWFKLYATPELFQRAFAHEFTHEFMDMIWRRTDPLWFAEGMAEYFSNIEWRAGILVPGQVNIRALTILRSFKPRPLKEFFSMGREEMYGVHYQQLYSQAWSVVHFLFNRAPEMIQHLLQHGVLGKLFVSELERDWLEYTEDLAFNVPS